MASFTTWPSTSPPLSFFQFFWGAVTMVGGRVRALVRVGELQLRTRGMAMSRSVYGEYSKASTWQLHSIPNAVSGSGHTGNISQKKTFDAVIHTQENAHAVPKPASQAVLSII